MTAANLTAFDEQRFTQQIAGTTTLQQLLDCAGDILRPFGLVHAVVYTTSLEERAAYLPLLPLAPDVEAALRCAFFAHGHAGVYDHWPRRSQPPLQAALSAARLRQVYHLRVMLPQRQAGLFEVARPDVGIEPAELSALKRLGQRVADRLPPAVWAASVAATDSVCYSVS